METRKSKKDIPDWFPLSTYSLSLTEYQWLDQIVFRMMVKTEYENLKDNKRSIESFKKLIVENAPESVVEESSLIDNEKPLYELWGIKPLTAYEVAYLGLMLGETQEGQEITSEIRKLREEKNAEGLFVSPSAALRKASSTDFGEYVNFESEPFLVSDAMPRYPVSVDFDQDDETLGTAFEVWLAGVRGETGKLDKAFTERDLEDWKKFGVLAAFDLMMWAELNNLKFTDALIANSIWIEEEVDVSERFRKVTKKKVEMMFGDWSLCLRLWRQLELIASMKNHFKDDLEPK